MYGDFKLKKNIWSLRFVLKYFSPLMVRHSLEMCWERKQFFSSFVQEHVRVKYRECIRLLIENIFHLEKQRIVINTDNYVVVYRLIISEHIVLRYI